MSDQMFQAIQTLKNMPSSHADALPFSQSFNFGPRIGGVEEVESGGKVVGYYLPGDCRCIVPWRQGFAVTLWTIGEWGARARG